MRTLRRLLKKAKMKSSSTRRAKLRLRSSKRAMSTRSMRPRAQRTANKNSMTVIEVITRSSQFKGFSSLEVIKQCLGLRCKDSIRTDSSTGHAGITTGTLRSQIKAPKSATLKKKLTLTMVAHVPLSVRVRVKKTSQAINSATTKTVVHPTRSKPSSDGAAC